MRLLSQLLISWTSFKRCDCIARYAERIKVAPSTKLSDQAVGDLPIRLSTGYNCLRSLSLEDALLVF